MAKATDNVFAFDMNKFMPDFDMTKMFDTSKMMEDFSKAAGQFKMPGLDVDGLMAAQKKNIDALTVANKKAMESAQALAARQGEIFQATVDAATKAAGDVSKAASPQEAATKQTEVYQVAVETALTNMRELADMTTKASSDVSETINTRFTESLSELKAQIVKLKK